MKIKFILLTCFLLGVVTIQHVNAQTKTPKVTKRQIKQQKRIVHGAKSGELTYKEAKNLEKQQKRINRGKRKAKSDGAVT